MSRPLCCRCHKRAKVADYCRECHNEKQREWRKNNPTVKPRPRKLPPDPVLAALIRFGFLYTDIADRFDVEPANVTAMARKLGFPAIPASIRGGMSKRRNGAKPASRYFG